MIAIIKYNAGNTLSVANALHRLGVESKITENPKEILSADKVIFPGVGEASTAMNYLKETQLDVLIKSLQQPFLGICLGLQLMCKHSEEGDTAALNIFEVEVKKFPPKLAVPHMGWNNLETVSGNLLKGISNKDNVYFVHSYYAEIGLNTTAQCNYILPFSAVLEKENFFATQFHPEKSSDVGEKILQNFLTL